MNTKRRESERIVPVSGLTEQEEKRFEKENPPLGSSVDAKREGKVTGENRPAE
ncbi:hypothetical protein [Thermicanus aegyptius]|uniref:hypothetical protein n=1 Tax=Thermicanus aegyptius TaxID=94009 RepID=UPI00042598C7|nr:hypothetical protein [Thermicanus aegyptius]